jgi:hypothetical protein
MARVFVVDVPLEREWITIEDPDDDRFLEIELLAEEEADASDAADEAGSAAPGAVVTLPDRGWVWRRGDRAAPEGGGRACHASCPRGLRPRRFVPTTIRAELKVGEQWSRALHCSFVLSSKRPRCRTS